MNGLKLMRRSRVVDRVLSIAQEMIDQRTKRCYPHDGYVIPGCIGRAAMGANHCTCTGPDYSETEWRSIAVQLVAQLRKAVRTNDAEPSRKRPDVPEMQTASVSAEAVSPTTTETSV